MNEINSGPSRNNRDYNNVIFNPDKEIDFLDIFFQLWKGKLLIAVSLIVCIMLAFVYLHFAKEKWTSSAILTQPSASQVANYNAALNVLYSQYPQDKISIADLQEQLFTRFTASVSALSSSLRNQENPQTLEITQIQAGQAPVNISFTAESAADAQAKLTHFIDLVNNEVVRDSGDDIKRNILVKQRELTESIIAQVSVLNEKKSERLSVLNQAYKVALDSNITSSNLSQAEYLSDDTLYLLGSNALKAMTDNEKTRPLNYDESYYSTKRALSAIENLNVRFDNLQSYRYIMKADLPIRKDAPSKVMAIVFAVILGLILGAVWVLTRNIVKNYRPDH